MEELLVECLTFFHLPNILGLLFFPGVTALARKICRNPLIHISSQYFIQYFSISQSLRQKSQVLLLFHKFPVHSPPLLQTPRRPSAHRCGPRWSRILPPRGFAGSPRRPRDGRRHGYVPGGLGDMKVSDGI